MEVKVFVGDYISAMQELRSEGYSPMTVQDVAKKRLEVLASGNKKKTSQFWDISQNTTSAVAYFKDEIKIIPNCEILTNIDYDAEILNGALVLTEDQYKQLPGKTFKHSELMTNTQMTRIDRAKAHPVLQELLGDDLEPYVDAVFDKVKKSYGTDKA
ncbi:MAG TPA: hypothetical protein ENN30_01700, partial [Candidatus Woesearchaeota archaeon]|nr:hypothetical protein [Candidatus Woesearchaeota archaeon]